MTTLEELTFNIHVACSVKYGRGWKLPMACWPDHRLLFVRGGSGALVYQGEIQELKRDDAVFGLPGETYEISQNERNPLVLSVVRFETISALGRNVTLPRGFRLRLCARMEGFPLLEQLAMRLIRSILKLPCRGKGSIGALLRSLLWLVRERHPPAGLL